MAHWREKTKVVGELSLGSELEFEINDKAAIEFKAIFKWPSCF